MGVDLLLEQNLNFSNVKTETHKNWIYLINLEEVEDFRKQLVAS